MLIWHFLGVCVLGIVPTAGFSVEMNRHDPTLPGAPSVMKDRDNNMHTHMHMVAIRAKPRRGEKWVL